MNKENVLKPRKREGFVPVQYRVINLTSDDIVSSPTVSGTMTNSKGEKIAKIKPSSKFKVVKNTQK